MYNPNWNKWVIASVTKYFDDNKSDLFDLFVEGDDYDENNFNNSPKRVELRINGPVAKEIAKDQWELLFDINCVITVTRDDQNTYTFYDIIGAVQALFINQISIYQYGDDDSLLGCLTLLNNKSSESVIVTVHGQIQPKIPILQAIIEGPYRLLLDV